MSTLSKIRKRDVDRQEVVFCDYKGFTVSLTNRNTEGRIMVHVSLRHNSETNASIFVAESLCESICYAKDFATLAVNTLLEHMDMTPKTASVSLAKLADAFDGWNECSAQQLLELYYNSNDENEQYTLASHLKDQACRLTDKSVQPSPILQAEAELREILKTELDEASITSIIHSVGTEMSALSEALVAKKDEIEALSSSLNSEYNAYVMAVIQDVLTEYEGLSTRAEAKLTRATLIQDTIASRVQQNQ
ncbi:hypothetical protein [Neiella marina]|uniref:hypothetical protein n=1 Tax=Neiella marina TaxID=508461 RepID=UPI001180845C|nr:hypothetical protein [Neiella marina]